MCAPVLFFPFVRSVVPSRAWLGFYNGNLKKVGWSKHDLVRHANAWAVRCCGARAPPALAARTVGKMGMKGVPGLRVEGRNGVPKRAAPAGGGHGRGRGRGGGGGGGGGRRHR